MSAEAPLPPSPAPSAWAPSAPPPAAFAAYVSRPTEPEEPAEAPAPAEELPEPTRRAETAPAEPKAAPEPRARHPHAAAQAEATQAAPAKAEPDRATAERTVLPAEIAAAPEAQPVEAPTPRREARARATTVLPTATPTTDAPARDAAVKPVAELTAPELQPELTPALPKDLHVHVSDRQGSWSLDVRDHKGSLDLLFRGDAALGRTVNNAADDLRAALAQDGHRLGLLEFAAGDPGSGQRQAPEAPVPVVAPSATPRRRTTTATVHRSGRYERVV